MNEDHRNTASRAPSRALETLGFVAVTALAFGPALGWLRALPAIVAFYLFALGGILGTLASLWILVRAVRGRVLGLGAAGGLLSGIVFLWTAFSSPRGPVINDFSTDLDDPPEFVEAARATANLARDMNYDQTLAPVQQACCGDLAPIEMPGLPAALAFERVQAVASSMPGWTVVATDAPAGRLEAVAETPLFGFRDDVVVRIRPEGAGSRVDMRSKSRDGRGDLGANAARIRAFRERLLAAAIVQLGRGHSGDTSGH